MLEAIFALFSWLFSPDSIINLFKRLFFHKKIDAAILPEEISRLNLKIANGSAIKMGTYVHGRSCVFFPVVPKAQLSIIHLVFAEAIKGLYKLGFSVKILVFDDYYRRVTKCDSEASKQVIDNFCLQFSELGIKKNDIKLESKYIRSATFAKKFLHRLMDLCAMVSIDDVRKLQESTSAFTKAHDSYIRQQKLMYNLAYISLFDNIGFVLCGADEVPMWLDYIQNEKKFRKEESVGTRLVILSIKKMKTTSGGETSIWDDSNLCTKKTREDISSVLQENLTKGLIDPDCGVFYLLENLYFAQKKTFEFNEGDKTILIKSTKGLIDEINQYINGPTHEIPKAAFEGLVDCIYTILNCTEG